MGIIGIRFSSLALICLFSTVQQAFGVTTVNSTTGGYTFTIAIEGAVAEPENDTELASTVEKIRKNIQDFSLVLFHGARGSFHLEAVNLVLPASWVSLPSLESYPYAETDSYSNADIRLSSTVTHPHVLNPNQCGLPGKFIELPADFFTDSVKYGLMYGSTEKALLTLWARFRWGVWEEHGYPSLERFPYFYRTDPKNKRSWEATGCSDTKLAGDFKNALDDICFAPHEACRFHPAPGSRNNATSSLMGYHWLETVTEFCNHATHNKRAPNKQNLFCNYRSVREVIEASPDFPEFPVEDEARIPLLTLNVLRENSRPVFHLLLDGGLVESGDNTEIMDAILSELESLFDEARTTVGAVTAFSGAVEEFRWQTLVKNLVPWKKIGDNHTEFSDALENFQTDCLLRDFTVGLAHVINSIRELNPHGGAIVLVVKSGATETYFDSLQYSEEEILSLALGSKTRIFAAEVRHSPGLPFLNLRNIANETGGRQEIFDDPEEASQKIQQLVESILEELDSREVEFEEENVSHVFFKGKLAADEIRTIRLPKSIVDDKIQTFVHLTLPSSYDPVLKTSDQSNPEPIPLERPEWEEEDDAARRIVRTYTLQRDKIPDVLELLFYCRPDSQSQSQSPKCTESTVADLLVIGDLYAHPFANVEVHTQTNVVHGSCNRLDFALEPATPFVIHTSVLAGRKPVLNAAVQATITNEDGGRALIILKDDGPTAGGGGAVDVQTGDGVYSGAFVPDRNGIHKISVQIETLDVDSTSGPRLGTINEFSRLLPVNQEEIGCPESECGGISLEPYFYIHELEDVTFVNVESFAKGTPSNITDFSAVALHGPALETEDIILKLTFTSPSILGVSNSGAKASKYFILGSNHWDTLFSSDPSNADVVQEITTTHAPGSVEVVQQSVPSAVSLFRYYVVYAFYSDFPVVFPELWVKSNIAHLADKNAEPEEATSTSTETPSTSRTGEPGPDPNPDPSPSPSTSTTGEPGPDPNPDPSPSPSTPGNDDETVSPTTLDPEDESSETDEPVSTSTELPGDDDKKPFFKTAGGIVVITLIILIGIAAVGGIGYCLLKSGIGSTA